MGLEGNVPARGGNDTVYRFRVPRAGGGTAPVPPVSPITRSNRNILPNGGIFLLELKLRGLEGRIRKGACDAFSRPGERMERPRGQGGAQPSSEMSGESHYPLQQKYPPEWGDIFVGIEIEGTRRADKKRRL